MQDFGCLLLEPSETRHKVHFGIDLCPNAHLLHTAGTKRPCPSNHGQAGYLSVKTSNSSTCAQWGFLSLFYEKQLATIWLCPCGIHLLIAPQRAKALVQGPAQQFSSMFTSTHPWEVGKRLRLTAWPWFSLEILILMDQTGLSSFLHCTLDRLEHLGDSKIHGCSAAGRNHGFQRGAERT